MNAIELWPHAEAQRCSAGALTNGLAGPAGFQRCVVCDEALQPGPAADRWRCPACGYQASTFAAAASAAAVELDDLQRRRGLAGLRRRGARAILGLLGQHRSLPDSTLCDVGCGYGWLLDEAERLGVRALGIEPDQPVAAQAIARGRQVRCGRFPDCLAPGERFDLVTLCDVFEHLPEPRRMLAAIRQHLAAEGLLAITLPTSDGALFRAATLLDRCGVRGPLDRLWQRGYPSPHLHYFQARNLARLATRAGFELLASRSLPAWQLRGLWSRLRMDPGRPAWKSAACWLALAAGAPASACLPSDILLHVYRAA